MSSRTGSAQKIWGDLKKSVSWVESCLGIRRLAFAYSRRPCDGCTWDGGGGGRWKALNRKNVYLSPYVEEPLNSKVIKSFVPELRSRKCFSCFENPMFYVYMLWTFYVHFTYPYHGYGTAFLKSWIKLLRYIIFLISWWMELNVQWIVFVDEK